MRPLVEVQDVHQSFRVGFWLKNVEILRGVNLNVPERSIFGFLGANGAGKTTLIHLIAGLRLPSSGRVLVGGADAHTRAARARIGYLPERPYFHEHLTGEGLLRYFGGLSGMSPASLRSRVPEVLEIVGLAEAAKVELRRYSKGMLQRAGIAQAMLADPEFLLLDEPMSGLDPLGRKEMRELILRLASSGHTIFFSSHVIPDVEAICDQVALIQKGRILGCGPISGFLGGGTNRTEIIAGGLGSELVRAIPGIHEAREIPDGVRAIAEGADINPVIGGIIAKGGKIVSVTPVRPTLESMFSNPSAGGAT
jgi:ABC-2 type transport system ATP-binding protein